MSQDYLISSQEQEREPQETEMVRFRPLWLERKPIVVPVFLGLNLLVFLGWNLLSGTRGRTFFFENFLISTAHLKEGFVWTLVTSAFSHIEIWHFLLNMVVLHSFGGLLERFLGPQRFLRFYLTAAVVSSLSHCLVSSWLMGDGTIPALGASGALAGLLLVFALLFPKQRILVFGILPVPALLGAIAFIGLDIWGLVAQSRGGGLPIGHGAHLGGAFAGIVYYFWVLRPRLR